MHVCVILAFVDVHWWFSPEDPKSVRRWSIPVDGDCQGTSTSSPFSAIDLLRGHEFHFCPLQCFVCTVDKLSDKWNTNEPATEYTRLKPVQFMYFIWLIICTTTHKFPPHSATYPSGPGLPHYRGCTSLSVGLLWTREHLDAEACTLQHITLARDTHTCLRRDSNSQSQQ